MTLKLRSGTYWIDLQINGKRLRESLKTSDKKEAQEKYDLRRAELWRTSSLKEKPKKIFKQACDRWLIEKASKRSIEDDRLKIKTLARPLGKVKLTALDADKIEAALPSDVKPATRNRYRALVRAMLNVAVREWKWIDVAPFIKQEKEDERRVTFLTRQQAEVLIAFLPEKYRTAVRFALLTGLRRSNVFQLLWEDVNLETGMVIVHGDTSKSGKRILVPLNSQAKTLLASMPEPRSGRVWAEDRIWCNTWKKAVKLAGVPGFRFHDLRHTWASWHAMAGTPLSVLQELGGWHSYEMVQRYAHLSPEHLANAAERVTL